MTYILHTVYNDCTSKTEEADLPSIMRALAIYWEDPNMIFSCIWRKDTGEIIANFDKEGLER